MSARRKILAASIFALALVAVVVSAYLTWVIWQSGSVMGCTGESLVDCDSVLTSRWSKWFGVPVSLLGGLTYLLILGLCWPAANRSQGMAMLGLFAMSMLAMGSAIWFVGLQAIQLQSFCTYCLMVHACGLGVGVLSLFLLSDRSGADDLYDQRQVLFGVAANTAEEGVSENAGGVSGLGLLASLSFSAVGLVALMGGQLLSEAPDTLGMEEIDIPSLAFESSEDLAAGEEQVADGETTVGETSKKVEPLSSSDTTTADPPENAKKLLPTVSRKVTFEAIPYAVDISTMPVVGNINAPHVMYEMMDYTCKHCRKLHPVIRATLDRYGDRIGIVIHHVPLSKDCNKYVTKTQPISRNACEYAHLAIGVWKLAPEKFPDFHNWLLESEAPPGIVTARGRALSLVGDAIFDDKKSKAEVSRRLANQIEVFRKYKTGLPMLLMKKGAIRGVPKVPQVLFDHLEQKLGIVPLSAEE